MSADPGTNGFDSPIPSYAALSKAGKHGGQTAQQKANDAFIEADINKAKAPGTVTTYDPDPKTGGIVVGTSNVKDKTGPAFSLGSSLIGSAGPAPNGESLVSKARPDPFDTNYQGDGFTFLRRKNKAASGSF